MDMDMRSAEAGCGQRAFQGCDSSHFGPRLKSPNLKYADFRSLAPTVYLGRPPILILILLEGW